MAEGKLCVSRSCAVLCYLYLGWGVGGRGTGRRAGGFIAFEVRASFSFRLLPLRALVWRPDHQARGCLRVESEMVVGPQTTAFLCVGS